MARALVVCALALLAACHGAGTPCGDGYCQTGTLCTADREHCVYPEQLTSCVGLADGTACDMRGIDGACRGDVCLPIVCGDGFVQPGEEECDGISLGGHTDCLSLGEGYHQAGSLSCRADCTLDRTACGDRCGDGITQAPHEACDVTVGTQTCEAAGFHGGTLGCKPDCQLDVSSCDGRCGDGILTSQEECDRTDFGLATCNTYGYYGGNLRCTDACKIADDQCVGFCGDGIKNGSEFCDGADPPNLSCQSYGFYGGTITCRDDCLTVDRSACEGFCGDGIRNGSELCDGHDHRDNSCVSMGAMAGALECNAYCQTDTSTCYWATPIIQPAFTNYQPSALWGSSPVDIWVAYGGGALYHYDGRYWTRSSQLDATATRIWNVRDATWARTRDRDLYRLAGTSSTLVVTGTSDMRGLWATTAADVWVGLGNQVRHHDGTSWTVWTISSDWTGTGDQQIWGTGANDVWIEGSGSAIHHFDGSQWIVHNPPGEGALAMWGSRPDDLWVVRDPGMVPAPGGVNLLHYDGAAWTEVVEPGIDAIHGGWFTSTDDLWLVGTVGAQGCLFRKRGGGPALAQHCEPSMLVNQTWAHESGEIWFADQHVYRMSGAGWRVGPTLRQEAIVGFASPARGQLLAGSRGTLTRFVNGVAEQLLGPWEGITGVVAHRNAVWVGSAEGLSHASNNGWTHHDVAVSGNAPLCRTSDSDVWLAARDDGVWHYDGQSLESVPSPPLEVDTMACGPGEVWALTRQRAVARQLVGRMPHTVPLSIRDAIAAIVPVAPDDTWFFGGNSYRYDGLTLVSYGLRLTRGVAFNPRNVWGFDGVTLRRFDGNRWSRVALPIAVGLLAGLATNDDGELWIHDGLDSYVLDSDLPGPYGGACGTTSRAYCNVTLRGHTAQSVDGPTDCDGIAHAGGELHYKIELPVDGRLTAEVTSRYDVGLSIVRADDLGGCDVASCVGTPVGDDKLELEVRQGETYFLVVGAVESAVPFTLGVDCEKL